MDFINHTENSARVTEAGTRAKALTMNLFSNDLYRNFGIGFLLGGIGVALTNPGLNAAITAVLT